MLSWILPLLLFLLPARGDEPGKVWWQTERIKERQTCSVGILKGDRGKSKIQGYAGRLAKRHTEGIMKEQETPVEARAEVPSEIRILRIYR